MRGPTGKLPRSLEVAANVAILVVAVVIVGKFLLARHQPVKAPSAPAIGATVSVPGVNWAKNESTLVMVLQRGCRYCEESAGFYHRIHEQRAERRQPRIVAILSSDKADAERYLSDLKISVDDILNASLSDVKVSATPTLMLVDKSGHVKDVWVGKLNDSQEREVSRRLFDSP